MQSLHRVSASDLQKYLETPEELLRESEEMQIAIAAFSDTPQSILAVLINSDYSSVVEASRLHVNFAGEITGDYQETIAELLQNLDLGQNDRLAVELMQFATVAPCFVSEWVPESLLIQGLQNEYMPLRYRLQLLERLSRSDKLEARLVVAESLETPVSLLEFLAGDLELAVRLTVESNPNCPSEVVELVKSQHDVANDWDAGVERLRELGESRWSWIRLTVAQNPFAPDDVLMKLATDELFKIRLGIGKNPNSTARVLGVLAEESLRLMQVAVVEHPNVGEETLHKLFASYKSEIEKREDLPRSILERFYWEKLYKSSYLFFSNYNTPAWILADLANIDLEKVRANAIARKDSSPIIKTVEECVEDGTNFLADIAKHPQASVEILQYLSQYSNPHIKFAIAENPKAPEELKISLLQQLSVDSKANIRIKIASNPQTPIIVLEQLANASYKLDGTVELLCGLAPDITPNLLK